MTQIQRDQLTVAAERAVLVQVQLPGAPLEEVSALETVDFVMLGGKVVKDRGSSAR